ncbi:SMI1/KNR4 family protein [Streptomyces chilikensis]|uniref:SMI1/KNR4 family protein n=1 Tax=Streptomyces chilikensis TaxID=1194079 RepID=A0ABV3EJU7_9ACTN
MTETFDMHRRLSEALADSTEAWRFLREFAEYWQQPLRPGDGWSERELRAAEARLGLRLPAALREAYLVFGRRSDLTSNHDTLLAPDELRVVDGALVYRAENQGCAFWGVMLDALEHDDPGTVMRLDLADKAQERWEAWNPSLTAACVEMVMSEAVQYDKGFTDYAEWETGDAGERLRDLLQELPAPGPDSRWFSGPDVLVRAVEGFCVHARGRTAEAMEQLRETLPWGDWLEG